MWWQRVLKCAFYDLGTLLPDVDALERSASVCSKAAKKRVESGCGKRASAIAKALARPVIPACR
jgi:hypothetical protein